MTETSTDSPGPSPQEQAFSSAVQQAARGLLYFQQVAETMFESSGITDLPIESQQVLPESGMKTSMITIATRKLGEMTNGSDRGDLTDLVTDVIEMVVPYRIQEQLFPADTRWSKIDQMVEKMLAVPYPTTDDDATSNLWREKTQIVEARQFIGNQRESVAAWCGGMITWNEGVGVLSVPVDDRMVPAREGDWVVENDTGFFVYADEYFRDDYVRVQD